MTLQLGSVSVFYKQHCPVSVKFQTSSPILSSLEDALESMKYVSSWPALPKAGACKQSKAGRAEETASRLGGWRFKEANTAEVSDDEGHRDQGDADPHGRKQLVDGIGHHERAGACCHFGLYQ